jgi:hypothetical protein
VKFVFKSEDIIKIPGKTFEDLSIGEVGLMIDADSSLSPNGNDAFSSSALDVFLHNTVLKRPDLRALQKEILNNIYLDIPGERHKKINTEYLKRLSAELKKNAK